MTREILLALRMAIARAEGLNWPHVRFMGRMLTWDRANALEASLEIRTNRLACREVA